MLSLIGPFVVFTSTKAFFLRPSSPPPGLGLPSRLFTQTLASITPVVFRSFRFGRATRPFLSDESPDSSAPVAFVFFLCLLFPAWPAAGSLESARSMRYRLLMVSPLLRTDRKFEGTRSDGTGGIGSQRAGGVGRTVSVDSVVWGE